MPSDYIYRLRPTRLAMLTEGPTEHEVAATQAHFAYVQRAVEEGVALLAGRTSTADEGTFGIVIFRMESEEEAQAFMEKDPAVRDGVMEAELFPFRLALLARSWHT